MTSLPTMRRAAIDAASRWWPVSTEPRPDLRRDLWVAALVLAVVVPVFAAFLATRTSGIQVLASAAVFTLLFLPVLGLTVATWTQDFAGLARQSVLPVAAVWFGMLGLAGLHAVASGTLPIRPLLGLAFTGLVTFSALGSRSIAERPMAHPWRLSLGILTLWMTSEVGIVHGLALPPGSPGSFEAGRMLIFVLGLLAFLVVAPLPDVGHTLRFRRVDLTTAAVALVAFAAVAIPLGLRIGFINWSPKWPGAAVALARALGIYFMIALPEELLFRGAIQNLLERRWPLSGVRVGSLVVASIVFGSAHLNNGTWPNLRYMLLATIAGIAYGWVWQRTRRIGASALTHAAVDWIWATVFRN